MSHDRFHDRVRRNRRVRGGHHFFTYLEFRSERELFSPSSEKAGPEAAAKPVSR